MKDAPPLYLNAREAATELQVSPATLYAYVSRGLVRSEPVENSRARRYRADDIRALKNRRAPMPEARGLRAADAALPLLDSAVSTLTEEGPLYRGVSATKLAETASLEQAATLLWDVQSGDPFAKTNLPLMPAPVLAEAAPISRAIAVLAFATDADPRAFNRAPEGRAQTGARLMRLLTAAILSAAPSAAPIHRQIAQSWAPERKIAEDLIRRALVLLADHELNASTLATRVAASTGVSLYDAVIAGLAALKGPRHGGAGARAAQMVAAMTGRDVAGFVREKLANGEVMPGFGHSVYVKRDPRADALLEALRRAGADKRLTGEAPQHIAEATGLAPNIDYAIAVMMQTLGLAPGHELALFAMARAAGWVAHAIEQLESGQLIRPRARYVGPAPGRGGQGA